MALPCTTRIQMHEDTCTDEPTHTLVCGHDRGRHYYRDSQSTVNFLTVIGALWGESERGSMVGVYVSSHRKLIGHIGCCRSPQLLYSLLRWSCAHWLKRVASVLSDVPLSVATLRAESWALIRVLRSARLRHVSLTWLLSPSLGPTLPRTKEERVWATAYTISVHQEFYHWNQQNH